MKGDITHLRFPIALVVLALARQATATTAADVPCQVPSPPGQCVVSTPVTVSASSTLDFRPLTLVLTSTGTLDAGGGVMFVKAASVVLQPGSLLLSAGGRISVTATDTIQVQEISGTRAKVDVSGQSGGSITLAAGGNVTVNGQLLAVAEVVLGDGGTVDVTGATVAVGPNGKLSATGGRSGFGGDITISATTGSTTISGSLDTSAGADGGYIAIDGHIDVTTTVTAVINAKAGAGGDADAIDITAVTGKASLAGAISVAAAGSPEFGGSGGDVSVDAVGPITIDATIDASGAGLAAFGGSVDIATGGDIFLRGFVDVSAIGTGGSAGFASFDTRSGQVALLGKVDAIGPASGGDISAFSFNNVTVSSRLTADGPKARIGLKGCSVMIAKTARLSSATDGQNVLQASGPLRVERDGIVQAGANRFEYLDGSKPPLVLGSVTPLPTIVQNPNLFPCGGPPTTTTTSTTSTTVTTGRATTTVSTITVPVTTRPPPTTAAPTTTTSTSSTRAPTTTTTTVAPQTTTTAPPAGCSNDPLVDIDAVSCRLDTLATRLGALAADQLGGSTLRARFAGKLASARRLVDLARSLQGRKQLPKLRRANKAVGGFIGALKRAERRLKVSPTIADPLLQVADEARTGLLGMTR